MYSKFVDLIEGSVALVAFVAIATISISSVIALNPKQETPNGSIAGVQTDLVADKLPAASASKVDIKVEELFSNTDSNIQINKLDEEGLKYIVSTKTPQREGISFPFLSFKNTSGYHGNLKATVYVDANLKNNLNVNLSDINDTLILNNAETGETRTRDITMNYPSKKDFNLELLPKEPINYNYQIVLEIL